MQLPHLNTVAEIREASRAAVDRDSSDAISDARIKAPAQVWVERFAEEEEKTKLQEILPARAEELTQAQRGVYATCSRTSCQARRGKTMRCNRRIFEVARLTAPIDQPSAFKAIYRVLLDKEAGPKAGNLLAFLDRDFVIHRLKELPVDKHAFWRETRGSASAGARRSGSKKEREKIESRSLPAIDRGWPDHGQRVHVRTERRQAHDQAHRDRRRPVGLKQPVLKGRTGIRAAFFISTKSAAALRERRFAPSLCEFYRRPS